ncbi:MAG: non-canonical purine NTP diphosphatase [Dysgonamonadaceae bacterium]
MEKIVFVTNNKHKLEEIRQIADGRIQILSLKDINCNEDIAETGTTLKENALIKAQYIFDKYGCDCFSDDTGLEVDALNGAPGVYSARYAGETCSPEDNIRKLLAELDGVSNSVARFRTVIAFIKNGEVHYFEGEIKGQIIDSKHGTFGFGYDPIFMPDGYTQTFAELGEVIKNRISHRGIATQKLFKYLFPDD